MWAAAGKQAAAIRQQEVQARAAKHEQARQLAQLDQPQVYWPCCCGVISGLASGRAVGSLWDLVCSLVSQRIVFVSLNKADLLQQFQGALAFIIHCAVTETLLFMRLWRSHLLQ